MTRNLRHEIRELKKALRAERGSPNERAIRELLLTLERRLAEATRARRKTRT